MVCDKALLARIPYLRRSVETQLKATDLVDRHLLLRELGSDPPLA